VHPSEVLERIVLRLRSGAALSAVEVNHPTRANECVNERSEGTHECARGTPKLNTQIKKAPQPVDYEAFFNFFVLGAYPSLACGSLRHRSVQRLSVVEVLTHFVSVYVWWQRVHSLHSLRFTRSFRSYTRCHQTYTGPRRATLQVLGVATGYF
jgi:hypothetical protein